MSLTNQLNRTINQIKQSIKSKISEVGTNQNVWTADGGGGGEEPRSCDCDE